MAYLKHPYPAVDWAENGSFGGSQTRSAKWQIRKCGCGAVAMTDLLLYLRRHHGCAAPPLVQEAAAQNPIPAALYDQCCCDLQRKYLPMVPPFGINGLTLAGGITACCKLHGLPYRTGWSVSSKTLWSRIEMALQRDLPVILAIGPNLPALWQQHKLPLYRRRGDTYTAVTAVKAHYVTVTGMDETWLQVSSWGKEYYIHRQEYWDYGKTHSTFAVHNALTLEPTDS